LDVKFILAQLILIRYIHGTEDGPVAQLGERYTGSVEVDSSILFGSTILRDKKSKSKLEIVKALKSKG
jgi:hypothetical protein